MREDEGVTGLRANLYSLAAVVIAWRVLQNNTTLVSTLLYLISEKRLR